MIWIYLAAVVFGGTFVIPMLLGGLDVDADVELDSDLGLEAGDLDAADTVDTGDVDGAVSSFVGSLFSFRSMVFFLTFFGASGAVFTWLGTNTVLTLATALGLGAVAAALHALLFSFIKRTGNSSHRLASDIEGSSAKVVLPISKTQKGRIRTDIDGQPTFMVATPYGSGTFDVGDSVVVVEMQNGTAHVARLELDLAEQTEEK